MDLLDRLLRHDHATTRRLLELAASLPEADYDRGFDLGLGTLRRTFAHVVANVEIWTALALGEPAPDARSRPDDASSLIGRLDDAYARFADYARAVRDRGGWDERWTDPGETPARERSHGGVVAHLVTHSMHHRCQALFMLRRLGVEGVPEGDALSAEAGSIDPPGSG